MPKVNLEDLEKEAAKEVEQVSTITSKKIGDKTVHKGPHLEDWFDDYGECHLANQAEAVRVYNKANGLDEFGRSASQVALHKAKAKLIAEKQSLLDEAKKIDAKISSLKLEDFETKKAKSGK